MWISVDGVEGSGKTTLCSRLASSILRPVVSFEFSATILGRALQQAVETDPHVFARSPIGQSLAFLGEFCERLEQDILPASNTGQVVLVDRGYLSKYVYQFQVLMHAKGVGEASARTLLSVIFEFIPKPDMVVLLVCPLDTLTLRLRQRRYPMNEDRLRFIAASQAQFMELSSKMPNTVILDTSMLSQAELLWRVLDAVSRYQLSSPVE